MKHLKLIPFFILSIFCTQLLAQGGISIKLSGGVGLPLKPTEIKDAYKMGFHGGAAVMFHLSKSVTIEGEADYTVFKIDDDKLLKEMNVSGMNLKFSGGDLSSLTIMGNLKLYLVPATNPLSLYVFGGGGLASVKFAEIEITIPGFYTDKTPSTTESKAAAQAGAGIQIGAGSLTLFAEAKYVNVFTEDESFNYAPVRAGLIFNLK